MAQHVSLHLVEAKALFSIKETEDWCHICGNRTTPFVEFSYSTNAEHTVNGVGKGTSNYVRMCANCIDAAQGILTLAKVGI